MSDNPIFSFTHRSYEDARQEGIAKIPFLSRGDWTDCNSTDPGIIILDYVHALVDMIQFYQDHNALESFLSTAKERKNIFRLAKQLGYTIRSAKGATCDLLFSIPTPLENTVIIPKYTSVSTNSNPRIQFLTKEEAKIYPGELSVVVPCVQGTIMSYTYKGTGISSLDDGLYLEDQYVELTTLGIDTDTIEITDNKSINWNNVNDVVFSDSGSKDFCTLLQPNGTVKVQFGNDERGYTPKETDTLYINYMISLGSLGRVGANSITLIDDTIKDDKGNNITQILVTNPSMTTGGNDPEDSESIRSLSPSVIKAQDRAVTLSDYEALAKKISGVKSAKAYDINIAPDLCNYYEVKVLIIPDVGSSSKALNTEVYNYLYERCIPPTVLTILDPTYKIIDINCEVVSDSMYSDDSIKYNVYSVLENYFDSVSSELGFKLIPNALISVISSVPGVLYVNKISPNTVIELEQLSIPKLGNVNITVSRKE